MVPDSNGPTEARGVRSASNTALRIYGYLEYSCLGRDIVNICLPHQLHTALPNGDYVTIGKQELLFNLLDVIHIHQKTLMTAQETPVSKLFFYGIQGLVDGVRSAGLGMKNTLGIAALNIQDLMVNNLGHRCPLPDVIGTGVNIPSHPVHDHL